MDKNGCSEAKDAIRRSLEAVRNARRDNEEDGREIRKLEAAMRKRRRAIRSRNRLIRKLEAFIVAMRKLS